MEQTTNLPYGRALQGFFSPLSHNPKPAGHYRAVEFGTDRRTAPQFPTRCDAEDYLLDRHPGGRVLNQSNDTVSMVTGQRIIRATLTTARDPHVYDPSGGHAGAPDKSPNIRCTAEAVA